MLNQLRKNLIIRVTFLTLISLFISGGMHFYMNVNYLFCFFLIFVLCALSSAIIAVKRRRYIIDKIAEQGTYVDDTYVSNFYQLHGRGMTNKLFQKVSVCVSEEGVFVKFNFGKNKRYILLKWGSFMGLTCIGDDFFQLEINKSRILLLLPLDRSLKISIIENYNKEQNE